MAEPTKQCFRCGQPLEGFQNSGMVTIAGFFSNNGFPYYNTFHLCVDCHERLDSVIKQYLFSYEGDYDGSNDPR